MSNNTSDRSEPTSCPAPGEPTTQLRIPSSVAADIEARLDRTQFASVDDYASFALETLLRELETVDAAGADTAAADAPLQNGSDTVEKTVVDVDTDDELANTEEDLTTDAMRKRLESLGYL